MTTNKGMALAIITAVISGAAVFFNKFALTFWPDSSIFTTAKNLVAAIFLCSLILLAGRWHEIKKLNKNQWLVLMLIGLVGGSVPFLLFFKALSLTSAVSAAFLHKTLFLWVALLAIPFLKEKISCLQFLALAILVAGVFLFSQPARFVFGLGEILALSAAWLWAIENIIAKLALKNTPAILVGWGRMFFGSIFLLICLLLNGSLGRLWATNWSGLGWLFLSGGLLFGYVISWYAALKCAPATVVTSILVLAAPITALLDSVFVTHKINTELLIPTALIVLSLLAISKLSKLKNERPLSVFKIRSAA